MDLQVRKQIMSSNDYGSKYKVTVVIPNYNGLKFMEPCFQALERQECPGFHRFGGGQRLSGRKRGVAEGTRDPLYFPEGEYGVFRGSERRHTGSKNALCHPVKQ